MRTIAAAALLLLLTGAGASPAGAHSHKKAALEIVHPWTPAMLDVATKNVPVYMRIKNGGRGKDRLVGARTPFGEKVELIEMQRVGGVSLPMPVQAFDVPKGELHLSVDGRRLLVSGIKRVLPAYDHFPLTLLFEKAGAVDVDVEVEEGGATEPHKH